MIKLIIEHSQRITNTRQLKELVEEEIKRGRSKYFSYPGYPEFAYFEVDHPWLANAAATAIRKNGSIDASTHAQSRNPDDWYYIIFNSLDENQKAMCAIHEYSEIQTQSHYEATQVEREFSEKFGMLQDFMSWRTEAARQATRDRGLRRSYISYPNSIKDIAKENGLTLEETESAVADIVADKIKY